MRLHVAPTPEAAAEQAARHAAEQLREAIAARGRATLALSGGRAARAFLAALARQPLDWPAVQVFQADERLAPAGDAARNSIAIRESLVTAGPLPAANLHAMPVETAPASAAVAQYEDVLALHLGRPPVLDVVQLGLGADGHTASLFPGDAAAEVVSRAVALAGEHAGYRRMTLTLPVLSAARCVLWLVTGADKAVALAALLAGARAGPASRVSRQAAVAFADLAAQG